MPYQILPMTIVIYVRCGFARPFRQRVVTKWWSPPRCEASGLQRWEQSHPADCKSQHSMPSNVMSRLIECHTEQSFQDRCLSKDLYSWTSLLCPHRLEASTDLHWTIIGVLQTSFVFTIPTNCLRTDTKLSGFCTFHNYDAFQDTFQNTGGISLHTCTLR